MKCGVAVIALNSLDWERVNQEDWSRGPAVPDHEILDDALAIGDLVEPLGFDSLWSAEHFGTPYGMVPNALQFLAFWAARTERIDLGSLVVVLPWHHPIQVAHEIAMLDILLKGRTYTIGVGRGLSPKEFGPLGIPQDEARERFDEAVDIIRLGLTQERFSYDGKIFQIPETSIRPQPRNAALSDTMLGAFMTETSLEAIAKAGLGHIVVSQQTFDVVGQNTVLFNQHRASVGLPPDSQPTMYAFVYCAEDEEELAKGYAYHDGIGQDGALHYGYADPATFSGMKGYEQYATMMAPENRASGEEQDRTLVGTPEQLIEKIRILQEKTSARELVVAFNFHGSMPHAEAERSMRLFAEKVLPAVQALETPLHHVAAAS